MGEWCYRDRLRDIAFFRGQTSGQRIFPGTHLQPFFWGQTLNTVFCRGQTLDKAFFRGRLRIQYFIEGQTCNSFLFEDRLWITFFIQGQTFDKTFFMGTDFAAFFYSGADLPNSISQNFNDGINSILRDQFLVGIYNENFHFFQPNFLTKSIFLGI